MKKIILAIFLIIQTGCAILDSNGNIEKNFAVNLAEVAEARNNIFAIKENVKTIRTKFAQLPIKINDKIWLKAKLKCMNDIDQEIRTTMIKTLLNKQWSMAVKRAYLVYFFNLDATINHCLQYGYLHFVDYQNNEELKQLLTKSTLLKEDGWVTISKFGVNSDYYAWLICQHAIFYDATWQKKVLIPRLKLLATKQETNPLAWRCLTNMKTRKGTIKMVEKLQNSNPPWSNTEISKTEIERFFSLCSKLQNTQKIDLFDKKYSY